jgi:hypothetical protein
VLGVVRVRLFFATFGTDLALLVQRRKGDRHMFSWLVSYW